MKCCFNNIQMDLYSQPRHFSHYWTLYVDAKNKGIDLQLSEGSKRQVLVVTSFINRICTIEDILTASGLGMLMLRTMLTRKQCISLYHLPETVVKTHKATCFVVLFVDKRTWILNANATNNASNKVTNFLSQRVSGCVV